MEYKEAQEQADQLISGAVAELKRPSEIPNYKSVDTSAFKKEVQRVDTSREVAQMTVGAERDRYNDAAQAEKEAIGRSGAADADKIRADADRAKLEASIYTGIINSLGVNPEDIAAVGARLREARPAAEAKLRDIQQAQRVSPLDNPLEWFSNQVTLPSQIKDYNRETDFVTSLEHTLEESITTANNAALLNSKSIPTITAAQAQASASKALSEAAKAQAQADERLAAQNINFAQQKLANDLALANMTKDSTQLDIQQANTEFQAQIHRITVADNHTNRLLRAAELLEKIQDKKQTELLLKNYDKVIGNPAGTTSIFLFNKLPATERENIAAIAVGSGGADPFNSLVNVARARPGPLFTSTKLFNWLQGEAETVSKTPEINAIDKQLQPAAISKRLKARVDEEKAQAYKPGNIFYEASPAEMIASGAVDKDSELAKVLAPFAQTGQSVPTGVVVAAITDKWKNPSEAGAVLSDYYKRNVILRNSTVNYRLAGITPDSNYIVPMNLGILGGRISFDLTNPADATKMILMVKSQQTTKQMLENFRNTIRLPGTEEYGGSTQAAQEEFRKKQEVSKGTK